MNIQYNPNAAKRPIIYADEIEFYAKQLSAFVKLYRDTIYIATDAQAEALNELEYYAMQLSSKNYDAVILNAHEIISKNNMIGPPWEEDDVDWI